MITGGGPESKKKKAGRFIYKMTKFINDSTTIELLKKYKFINSF